MNLIVFITFALQVRHANQWLNQSFTFGYLLFLVLRFYCNLLAISIIRSCNYISYYYRMLITGVSKKCIYSNLIIIFNLLIFYIKIKINITGIIFAEEMDLSINSSMKVQGI